MSILLWSWLEVCHIDCGRRVVGRGFCASSIFAALAPSANKLGLIMTKNKRIFNVSRGYSLKRGAAERAIQECSAAWVEEGVSIRNLTLAESIAARNEQARHAEPLPFAEIPGLRFEPTLSGTAATRRERLLTWQAHEFVMNAKKAA
jgi:hypothetical protein